MNGEQYKQYLLGQKWSEKRNERLNLDCGRCRVCMCTAWRRPIEVHHLHYRNVGNENMEDLVSLCHKCHGLIHELPSYDVDGLRELMRTCAEDFSSDPKSADDRRREILENSSQNIQCPVCSATVGLGLRSCWSCGYNIQEETCMEGESVTPEFVHISAVMNASLS